MRARIRLGRPPHPLNLADIAPGPFIVSGFLDGVIGLGSAARQLRVRLAAQGLPSKGDDISPLLHAASWSRPPPPSARAGGVWILSCNPPEQQRLFWSYGDDWVRSRYRIGCVAWELERLPADWTPAIRAVNEVWACSRFVADAVRRSVPDAPPVRVTPIPIPSLADATPDRAAFGLAEDATVFLVMFDLRSTRARKNPDAAVEAYLRAFSFGAERVQLVCKVVAPTADPAALDALKRLAHGRADIVFLTEHLTDAGVHSLIASCDVIVSLHRAEGYGLVLAEAMKLQRCVVATGWSGNMDFMDETCAELISYTLVDVDDPSGAYGAAGARWAEPDVAEAARVLERLHREPGRRARLGAAGQARIEAHEASFPDFAATAPWAALVQRE